jgi:hypothetical protein
MGNNPIRGRSAFRSTEIPQQENVEKKKEEVEPTPQDPPVVQPVSPPAVAQVRQFTMQHPMIVPEPQEDKPKIKLPARPAVQRQPSQHDRRSEVPYEYRIKRDNVRVDRRLWPYWDYELTHNGQNITDAFNRMILKYFIEKGYEIDPDILDRPMIWEDIADQFPG